MTRNPNNVLNEKVFGANIQVTFEKKMLALDALSKLSKQFSNKPNFESLIDVLLLTLSGQFAVTNAFAAILKPGSLSSKPLYNGTGKFKQDKLLSSLKLTEEHQQYFLKNNSSCLIENLDFPESSANLEFILQESNVKLVAPLIHNNKLIGIIGISERITQMPFEKEDIELLDILINTVTSFIANSFLFMEISNLNIWYQEILNSVKQGVFVFGSDDLLKSVNDSGFEILKELKPRLTRKESIYNVPIQFIFSESIFHGWIKRITQIMYGQTSQLFENMIAKSNDIEKIFNVRISKVRHETNGESDLIITLDDLTVQKESERRLFDLEKFADKGVMASSISHELNNFLGMILGGVELAEVSLDNGNTEKTLTTLTKLKGNVANMKRYTAGLMDYTKLDTNIQYANLNNIIVDVLSFIAVQKKFKGIKILNELDTELIEFEMDPDQMAQLLLNLLNNSADAINEVGTESGQIVIKTYLENNQPVLSVTDNGIGIKPEVKEKLFKDRLTTKEKGHGFGLVTCNKIIENHKGQIEIISEVGKGTTFIIRFSVEVTDKVN